MGIRLFLFLLFVQCLLHSCANQLALTGGPRDEDPPVLDTTVSFKNYQTSFIKSNIDLYFDEFVSLRNPIKQVVISPPLDYIPVIENRGKRVSIKFGDEEVLKENATYVINFGESIVDFNESNKLENFTLVFSTGNYIDSLSIRGGVVKAFDKAPAEEVLVMLYESKEDSVVYQERPFYFAKTLEDGTFQIENLRADTFKLVVLKDENLNYLYDPQSEEIGFLDSLIILTDSSTFDLDLEIFREYSKPRYSSYEVTDLGRLQLQFTGDPELASISILDSTGYFIQKGRIDGEVVLWYQALDRPQLTLEYVDEEEERDTISFRINTRNTDPFPEDILLVGVNENDGVGIHPDQSMILEFDRPIASLSPENMVVIDTSSADTLSIVMAQDTLPSTKVSIESAWPQEASLKVELLPGALTDIFGSINDTIERYVSIAAPNDFGSLNLQLENFPDEIPFVVEIKSGENSMGRYTFKATSFNISLERLVPGSYSVHFIADTNDNGKWDPGNYLNKVQSERYYQASIQDIREDWELEQSIYFDQLNAVVKDDSEDE